MRRFSGFSHNHIVTLLASWTIRKELCLLFPLASCDLNEYWKRCPQPKFDARLVRWMSQQIVGIAGALQYIHNPSLTITDTERQLYGVHGDIKPDNILLYDSTENDLGMLVLADLGSSRMEASGDSQELKSRLVLSTSYRAPEYDIRGANITRAYDVWSLGRVLLEFVFWVLGGQSALDKLAKEVLISLENDTGTDVLFDFVESRDGEQQVRVKLQVEKVSQINKYVVKIRTDQDIGGEENPRAPDMHSVLP